jgi:hypothetical protein
MQGKETMQKLGRDFLVAVFFILSIGGVGLIATLLKLPAAVNLQTFGQAIATVNILAVLWLFFLFVVVGGLALFWAKYASVFGKLVGLKAAQEPAAPTKTKIKILSVMIYGALVTIVIGGINYFFNGLNQNIDITNFNSIKTAILTGSLGSLGLVVIAFALVGFAIIHMRRLESEIDKFIPDQLKKF